MAWQSAYDDENDVYRSIPLFIKGQGLIRWQSIMNCYRTTIPRPFTYKKSLLTPNHLRSGILKCLTFTLSVSIHHDLLYLAWTTTIIMRMNTFLGCKVPNPSSSSDIEYSKKFDHFISFNPSQHLLLTWISIIPTPKQIYKQGCCHQVHRTSLSSIVYTIRTLLFGKSWKELFRDLYGV